MRCNVTETETKTKTNRKSDGIQRTSKARAKSEDRKRTVCTSPLSFSYPWVALVEMCGTTVPAPACRVDAVNQEVSAYAAYAQVGPYFKDVATGRGDAEHFERTIEA